MDECLNVADRGNDNWLIKYERVNVNPNPYPNDPNRSSSVSRGEPPPAEGEGGLDVCMTYQV